MLGTITKRISCPYCGEKISIVVDGSVEWQEYTEDCFVCCQPIIVSATVDDDVVNVAVRSEQDC